MSDIDDMATWAVGDDERWCPDHGWGCHCDAALPADRRWQHTIDSDLLERPALGAILRHDDVQARRAQLLAEGAWYAAVTRADHHARMAVHDRLSRTITGVRIGVRADILAAELRTIATQLEQLPARLAHQHPAPEAA